MTVAIIELTAAVPVDRICQSYVGTIDSQICTGTELVQYRLIGPNENLLASVIDLGAVRYVAHIETASSIVVLPGAEHYWMRGWDGTQLVYWRTDSPYNPAGITIPAASGSISRKVILGVK